MDNAGDETASAVDSVLSGSTDAETIDNEIIKIAHFDEDDDSCLETELQTIFCEPPYSAPLAPLLDTHIARRIERKKQKQKLRRRSEKRLGEYLETTEFIQKERLNDPNDSDYDNAPAKLAVSAGDWINDSHDERKHERKNKLYQDGKGVLNVSSASTLLLPDNECVTVINLSLEQSKPQINHINKFAKFENSNHQLPPTTPLVPMSGETEKEHPAFCLNPIEHIGQFKYNPSLFFNDGVRSIDYILAYKVNLQPQVEEENIEKRKVFEENLIGQGLQIEKVEQPEDDIVQFIKVHAPLEVLRRYAEILKLRMPMKELLCDVSISERSNRLHRVAHLLKKKIPGMSSMPRSSLLIMKMKGVFQFFTKHIFVDEKHFPIKTHRFTAIYSRDKEYLFDVEEKCFFTAAIRSRVVQFILDRQRYPTKTKGQAAFGIDRLKADKVYCAAYPLHDGEKNEKGTVRENLYTNWASLSKWYRYQPLDYIKEYFGVKIALYFAWLGYYTYMLLLATVVGLVCFIYSLSTMNLDPSVQEICNGNRNTTYIMCPICEWCDFWDLRNTCFYAKISYLIDNPTSVFFACFMSFWATLFLELWKRYSAEITHRWDLTGFDVHEEHPRPQYLEKLHHLPATRLDYVTNIKEPVVPFWRMKVPATIFSFSVVLLLLSLAFAALFSVVVYRISMLGIIRVGSNAMTTQAAMFLTTASAAFINLCVLFVLNYMYECLAEYLTELEMWRTQTQFDDSVTLKIYLLQFVNYYASIFYIAFFKGKFLGYPGNYIKIFTFRQEECTAGGCLTELCIQLAIIMIGKQTFNAILEGVMPYVFRIFTDMKNGIKKLFSKKQNIPKEEIERWLKDFRLLEWGPRSLFPEYLEMVLQYGFVTIFAVAFPLAPFFALLNNIFEMRLDAKKLLIHYRRPISQRVRNIGVWYRILDCIGKLSVISNALIIAFTSDFITNLVYAYIVNKDGSLNGYLDFSLSEFRISDSTDLQKIADAGNNPNLKICKYPDFREGPDSDHKYETKNIYYVIMAFRLGFVVVFENIVALVMILIRWCIPDMSIELRDRIRREFYITNEIVIEQEARRAQFERAHRRYSVTESRDDSVSTTTAPQATEQFLKVEKLLSGDLTQSQMDIIMHSENADTGISGSNA